MGSLLNAGEMATYLTQEFPTNKSLRFQIHFSSSSRFSAIISVTRVSQPKSLIIRRTPITDKS